MRNRWNFSARISVSVSGLFSLMMIVALHLATSEVARAAPQAKQTFPRLGLMLIGGDGHRYHEADYQRQLARYDFVVLNMNPAWAKGGVGATANEKQANVLSQIRRLNPEINLHNYTIVVETPDRETNAHGDVWKKVPAEKGPNSAIGNSPNDWWARRANGKILEEWPGTWSINITNHVTPDSNGYTFPEWFARRNYDRIFRNVPQWDGIYHDVARVKPRRGVDWDRDGDNDSPEDGNVQRVYRAAHVRQWDTERQLMPDMQLSGNIGSWGVAVVDGNAGSALAEYRNALEGGFLEKYMGASWSIEKNRGWDKMMQAYRGALEHTAEPKLVVLNAGDGDRDGAGFYQFFRYGFASVLMDDGYFDFSDDGKYNEIHWFDEYDLAGAASTTWLGRAIDPPQVSPWQDGVYRRRFENGMAIVNPRGNGSQTVQIESGYRFIRGNQDPAVNSGQAASVVTLRERDGVILVGAEFDDATRPAAPAFIE